MAKQNNRHQPLCLARLAQGWGAVYCPGSDSLERHTRVLCTLNAKFSRIHEPPPTLDNHSAIDDPCLMKINALGRTPAEHVATLNSISR
ncbi:hypothetical protein VNO80_26752 [Phaseolus coccineus]|uniref:Uncharacterized protein n=1 Tax=Phaseolus coccineus TaxID=3886 RepID=A0AAN9QKT0_PHACN